MKAKAKTPRPQARPITIYDPDGLLGDREPDVELEVAPLQVNGVPFNLRDWTREQWARLPERLRPRHAFQGDRGSWYAIDPES